MSRFTRPQIHVYGLAALLLLVVALGIALDMLGHATMSGGPQWSAGGFAGVLAAAFIVGFIALIVGTTAAVEWLGRGRRHPAVDSDDRFWFLADGADAAWDRAAYWAEEAAHEAARKAAYELEETASGAPRRRHAAGHR